MKGQAFQYPIILGVVLLVTAIFAFAYYKYNSIQLTTIQNSNINFILTFSYLNSNSIFLTLSENVKITNFNFTVMTTSGRSIYNYTVTTIGKDNTGSFAVVANSTHPYPSYGFNNICSINYKNTTNTKLIYSIVKNCTS